MENSLELLKIVDKKGEYLLSAEEVMRENGVKIAAVWASRRAEVSILDAVAVASIVAKKIGISLKDKKGSYKFSVHHTAKFSNARLPTVYYSREKGKAKYDKLLLLKLMQMHFLDGKICGDGYLMQAYIDIGIANGNYCIKEAKK